MPFADALASAITARRSVTCVGLDPVLEQLPKDVRARHHDPLAALREFCTAVIDAVADLVPVIKPQSACFERYGSRGIAVLEEVCAHALRRGLLILLDAKRGDIGISAEHYAAAARHLGAHAITVNAYLGPDTVTPYLTAGLSVFILVRTSNPDSDAVQSQPLVGGRTVAESMAELTATLGRATLGACGLSNIGAVVGATKSADAASLRRLMPDQVFLIPGYGAQGGAAADVTRMTRPGARSLGATGVLVNASRSIIYAKGDNPWPANVARAAAAMNAELTAALDR